MALNTAFLFPSTLVVSTLFAVKIIWRDIGSIIIIGKKIEEGNNESLSV